MNTNHKVTKSVLESIVLSELSKKPIHGYRLIRELQKKFGVYFGPSTMYPLLASIEKRGLAKSYWELPIKGHKKRYKYNNGSRLNHRPRKIYVITDKGMESLKSCHKELEFIVNQIEVTAQ